MYVWVDMVLMSGTGGGVGNGDQCRSLHLFAGIDSAVDLTG